VPSTRLRIEITEDAVMLHPERSLAVLRSLAAAGVGVSIDDSAPAIRPWDCSSSCPVDELKIDRSFISNLADEHDAAIAQTAIDLGCRLGLTVVPEGVEDADTLRASSPGRHLRPRLLHQPPRSGPRARDLAGRPQPEPPLVPWVAATHPTNQTSSARSHAGPPSHSVGPISVLCISSAGNVVLSTILIRGLLGLQLARPLRRFGFWRIRAIKRVGKSQFERLRNRMSEVRSSRARFLNRRDAGHMDARGTR
jgi:hypothetical protein